MYSLYLSQGGLVGICVQEHCRMGTEHEPHGWSSKQLFRLLERLERSILRSRSNRA
jgi:hypothetical protein